MRAAALPPPRPRMGATPRKKANKARLSKKSWPIDDKSDPDFNRFRENLEFWEGELANRPPEEDPGGPTNKGLSQEPLDLINDTHPEWGLREETKDP